MGGERKRLRKQILLYPAVCLTLFCGACAMAGTTDGGFTAYLGRGDCEQAYAALEGLKRALNDSDLFGYVILFSDRKCRYYDENLAQAYYRRLKSIYPESRYTAYAGQVVKRLEQAQEADARNTELTGRLKLSAKKLSESEAENASLGDALKRSDDNLKKISEENKELNERIKALNSENREIRQQLEKMKEVDMKMGGRIIGK